MRRIPLTCLAVPPTSASGLKVGMSVGVVDNDVTKVYLTPDVVSTILILIKQENFQSSLAKEMSTFLFCFNLIQTPSMLFPYTIDKRVLFMMLHNK